MKKQNTTNGSRNKRGSGSKADTMREILTAILEKLKLFALWLSENIKPAVLRFHKFMRRLNKPLLRSRSRLYMLFIFPVVLIYSEIVLRCFGGTPLLSGLGYAILFAFSYGCAINFIASFLKQKSYRIFMKTALFIIGALYAFESIMYASFQVYMTFRTIIAGTQGVVNNYSDTFVSAILGGIPRIILFLLPYILYCLYYRSKTVRQHLPRKISVELIVFALIFFLIGTGFSHFNAKYARQYEFDGAVKTFGLLTGIRLNAKYALFGNKAAEALVVEEAESAAEEEEEEEEAVVYDTNSMEIDFDALAAEETDDDLLQLDEYVDSLAASDQNEYTGIFEGKNLIMICAEAFSGAIISEELTPTLYRMQHDGIYFSDYYQPAWGGSTSTGEFSFLTGLVPTNETQSMQDIRSNNNYFTLGNQMQRLNYYTLAFHNGAYDYYDRQLTHYNLGFDTWLGVGNGIEDITGAWVDDDVTIDAMDDLFMSEEPFCVYWMTVSGHAAYDESDVLVEANLDRVTEVVGEDTYSDIILYYLCYQLALEDAMTILIEDLEEAGIADDTVICLTTDHYPYGLCESTTYGNTKDYLGELYGDSYDSDIPWERDKNAWLLWSGCLEDEYADLAVEVSEPTYSLDIVPTLSNLFGLEYDSRLLVGRDVFSDTDALVLWNNYSWKTVQGSYDSSTGEYTPNDGYEYDEDYVEQINTIVANKITYSSLVVSTDYYATLFGSDDVGSSGE